jgi:hypothetical protein
MVVLDGDWGRTDFGDAILSPLTTGPELLAGEIIWVAQLWHITRLAGFEAPGTRFHAPHLQMMILDAGTRFSPDSLYRR